MLEIQDMGLDVPGFSLRDNSFRVGEGEFFAIIGPTGSGKSLLLEAIAGLRPLSGGEISLDGRDITKMPSEKRRIGLVYQDYALFPHMDVQGNILYGVRRNKENSLTKSRFDFLVNRLRLHGLLQRRPATLSGGEKQRVALARSLILSPEAMLLDEPLSALDPVFQDELRELIRDLHLELGIPFLMVSHNFPEVMYLADRGAIINKGSIVQTGSIDQLFNFPGNAFCAKFTGVKNIFSVKNIWSKDLARYLAEKRDISFTKIDSIGFRPEDVMLMNGSGLDSASAPCFRGKILSVACHGVHVTVRLQIQSVAVTALWPRDYAQTHKLERGITVDISVDPYKVYCFDAKQKIV